jgi:hypothetical protein
LKGCGAGSQAKNALIFKAFLFKPLGKFKPEATKDKKLSYCISQIIPNTCAHIL